ncbi:nitrate/nitrite transporter NrtS [Zhongshania sp. BJYM1]|uniref:nitrate/nitrite transporter NrtS n=1 Tax=Zhongshania aquatica TaxID=2965069 RepID=UPI0033130162
MESAVKHFLRGRWFFVALIVGSLLNLINNFDYVLLADWDKVDATKVALTYIVPYLVSSISAWYSR